MSWAQKAQHGSMDTVGMGRLPLRVFSLQPWQRGEEGGWSPFPSSPVLSCRWGLPGLLQEHPRSSQKHWWVLGDLISSKLFGIIQRYLGIIQIFKENS
uniref:Uncharacterized protein n=1 Tax=Calidris pygmaea TaxID=425635 RepID=A0A8C3JMS1_9CHAR